MKNAKDVLKAIKDNDIKYVDLRFTDPRGKWQHVTFDQSLVDLFLPDLAPRGTFSATGSFSAGMAVAQQHRIDQAIVQDQIGCA